MPDENAHADQALRAMLRDAAIEDRPRMLHDLYCPMDGCRPRALADLAACEWTEEEYIAALRRISEIRYA
jgi:hypothetical protein